jgi:mannitol-1-phosphate 5-dehydrogenase
VKALIIGPGRIGCGFAGQLLRASGYDVVFVSRNRVMTDYLNRTHRYLVRLISDGKNEEVLVDGVRAVCNTKRKQVIKEISKANLIITAVGASNLPEVAPVIADGLRQRDTPLNIIAFENLMNAGSCLRNLVAGHLPHDFPLTSHGFSGALISRVVTRRLGDPARKDLLAFIGDQSATFTVDGSNLCKPLPVIKGMIATSDYNTWILHKLYIFSAGHATCAYLGHLKGYHYIHTAIRDPEIRTHVLAAMAEGQRGLAASYGPEIAGNEKDLLTILERFENATLNDPIIRVGRDPRRKLAPEDRLIGAARLAQNAGIKPETLTLAAAAALCFYNHDDLSAVNLQREIEKTGLESVLKHICGLNPKRGLGCVVARTSRKLRKGWQKNNVLLALNREFWAWRS